MTRSSTTRDFIAFDGALVFTMRPFRTVLTNILVADMESICPRDQWDTSHHAFCLTIGATVDVQCADPNHAEALAVAEYWEQVKKASTATKWELYPSYISDNADLVWWQAYQGTRNKPSVPAPKILQEGEPTDPNLDSSGGGNTTTNT